METDIARSVFAWNKRRYDIGLSLIFIFVD
jgi:hypothetical protein